MERIDPLNYLYKPDWARMWEKGIRTAWADDMIIRHGSIESSWDYCAKDYEDGEIKFSNRADLVDRFMASKPRTVLDIGGGTGIFAIPLAKLVKKVVVVEPSKGMLDILKEKANKSGLDNIGYVRKKWEDVIQDEIFELNNGDRFDVVLSSHSLYYITDLHRSFLKMNDVAKDYVYLFTGCTGYARDKDYEKLYLILHQKPLPPYPDFSCLYMVLRESGIQPDIEMKDMRYKKPIKNLDEVVDKWKEYLHKETLSDAQERAIREYLSVKVMEENNRLYQCDQHKDALIYWKVEQNLKEGTA